MAYASSMGNQSVLDMIKGFWTETDELSDQNEGRLKKLGEISEVAASVEKEGEANETSTVTHYKALIKNICNFLLSGPYTFILTQLADTLSIVKEMENKRKEDESLKLPKAMQERVDAVNDYLEQAKTQLKKVDDTLCGLTPKISEARKKRFRVSDEEITDLEMTAADVKRNSDACKTYLDQALNEINLLESDINSEIKIYQMKTAAKVLGFAAAGFFIAGARLSNSEILKLSRQDLFDKLATSAGACAATGTVIGGTAFYLHLTCVIQDGKKRLTSHLDILHTRLQKVETDFEIRKRDIEEEVTERMK